MNGQITILAPLLPVENSSTIEQKFLFDGPRQGWLLDLLEFYLVRDPEFYFSPIVSLYYDTPSLSLYEEVCNGNYMKTKVRLRHYQKEFPPEQESVTCYFEVKRRFGTRREKDRKRVTLDPRSLQGDIFSQRAIREMPDASPELRLLIRGGVLVPLLVVEYERHRFIDPGSGTRVSLDTGIRCSQANSAYLCGTAPVSLDVGVLEVKGTLDVLPHCLTPIERYLRKQAFSKYARCCELLGDFLPVGRPL